MRKVVVTSLILLAFTLSGFSQNNNLLQVNYTESWSDADVKVLASKINAEALRTTKMNALKEGIKGKPEGFTSKQTIMILNAFDMSRDKSAAVRTIDDRILGMTAKEVSDVLGAAHFPSDKITILQELRFCITDEENKYDVLDAIPSQKYKADGRKILDQVRQPRSFIYGTVKSKSVIFVVDLSGSMEVEFTANTGDVYSRLDFVKMELNKALRSLGDDYYFNIIFFESGIHIWKPQMQPATDSNVQSAMNFAKDFKAGGATNISDALEAAFAYNRAKAVYFLTDGMPTAGKETDVDRIINNVQNWNASRGITVYTTAFLSGDFLGDNKPQSRELMKRLATVTGGVYRAIE